MNIVKRSVSVQDLQNKTIEEIEKLYLQDNPSHLENESVLIRDLLYAANKLGFITFESQPYRVEGNHSLRFYMNGIYPMDKINTLLTKLTGKYPHAIIGVTLYTDVNDEAKDTIMVYNLQRRDREQITQDCLYSMFYVRDEAKYVEGYSGQIIRPVSRNEYFEDAPKDVLKEILEKFVFVQIWSRSFDDEIYQPIMDALNEIYHNV